MQLFRNCFSHIFPSISSLRETPISFLKLLFYYLGLEWSNRKITKQIPLLTVQYPFDFVIIEHVSQSLSKKVPV